MISRSPYPFKKIQDPARMRPTDITLQIPDTSKFREHYGWKPERPMEDIWDDLLTYWRKKL